MRKSCVAALLLSWLLLLLLVSGCDATAPVADVVAALPPTATLPVLASPTVATPRAATAVPLTPAPHSPTEAPTTTPSSTAGASASPGATQRPRATATATRAPCATPGQIVQGVINSAIAGPSPYRVYLPPCYGEDGRVYPTLYLLPGNIHSDSIWDELQMDETAEAGILAGTMPPLLIVMADGGSLANNTSGGPGSYESFILDELLPLVERTYCAWPAGDGRAIGGLSRGGYWALEIAFRHPEQFAGVGGHSAVLMDLFAGPDVNPEQTGLNRDLGDLRIYFDIGADDWYINNIRQLHEAMTAAGVAHEWVLNDGRHEEAYWAAHVADYLAWYTQPWPLARSDYLPCAVANAE